MAQDIGENLAASQPRLPQLLALAKANTTWQEKLLALRKVTGISSKNFDHPDNFRARTGRQAQDEWIFRYLLENLKQCSKSEDVRRDAETWHLLRQLLPYIPAAIVAKHINGNEFLTVLEEILVGLGPMLELKDLEVDLSSDTLSSPSSEDDTPRSPSRKRKRGEAAPPQPKRMLRIAPDKYLLQVAIWNFVTTLFMLSTDGYWSQDRIARAQLLSVWRTDAKQAAVIVKHLLNSIFFLHKNGQMNFITDLHLDLALNVWKMRRGIGAEENNASMRLFCDELLIPITNLVGYGMERSITKMKSRTQGRSETSASNEVLLNPEAMRSSLTELVGKNFLTPARAAFKAAQASRHPETFDFSVLRSVLANLRLGLTLATDNPTPKAEAVRPFKLDSKTHSMSTALQDITNYAVKDCKNTAGIVQDTDIAWIENLIAVFAECLGCPLTGAEIEPPADPLPVGALFDINEGRKLRINPEMLEELLKRYAGLSIPRAKQHSNVGGEPAWPLVRTVVEMNGDVFLEKRRKTSSAVANRISIDYRKALLNSLAEARLNQRNLTGEDLIVTGVIIGLMDAHIAARDFKGFIAAWHQGIAAAPDEIYYVDYGDAKLIPVWMSRTLVDTVRRKLETVMTPAQIIQLVNDYMVFIIAVSGQSSDQGGSRSDQVTQKSADAAAAFYIINVLLTSVESDELIKQLQPTFSAINQLICSFLGHRQEDEPVTSCWHLIRQIYHLMSLEATPKALDAIRAEYFSIGLISGAQSTIGNAAASVDVSIKVAQQSKALPVASREASDAAYHFIVTISAASIDNGTNVEEAQQALVAANAHIFQATASWRWVAVPDASLITYLRPELERCTSALVQHPQLLLAMRKEQRVDLFQSLLIAMTRMITPHHLASRVSTMQARNSIMALAETILQTGDVKLRDDLKHALVTGICDTGPSQAGPCGEKTQQLAVLMDVFAALHPGSMSRKDREATLDWLLSEANFKFGRAIQTVGLATEILCFPTLTSRICAEPELMIDLTTWLGSTYEEGESLALIAFSAFVKAVFRQIFTDPQNERKTVYIKKMNKLLGVKANKIFDELELNDHAISTEPREFMEVSMSWLEMFGDEASKPLMSHKMLAAIVRLIRKLLDPVERGAHTAVPEQISCDTRLRTIFKTNYHDSAVQIQLEEVLSLLLLRSTEVKRVIPRLESSGQPTSEKSENMSWRSKATASKWQIVTAEEPDARSLCKSVNKVGLLLSDDQIEARQALSLVDTLNAELKSRGSDVMANVLTLASRMTREQRREISRFAPIIIRDLEAPKEDEVRLSKLQQYLPSLLLDIEETTDAEHWRQRLYCVQVILKYKNWMITQYSVDKLLTTMTYITSPSCKLIGAASTEVLQQTCRTLQLLISSHRRRLNGRMHLVVPLLQGLMTCQFEPHSKYSTDKRPSWARGRSESQPRVQTAEAATPLATEYARLLTTLADPTVSAISSHHKNRKRLDLVDQTKKAREHFGMFAPNLITHFCSLQLNGYMEPEAREAMNPGLWACIDVIGEEGMSVMNDARGRDVRALWHTLHSGYKRARDRRG